MAVYVTIGESWNDVDDGGRKCHSPWLFHTVLVETAEGVLDTLYL